MTLPLLSILKQVLWGLGNEGKPCTTDVCVVTETLKAYILFYLGGVGCLVRYMQQFVEADRNMSKQMDLYRELSDSGVTDGDDPCSLCMKMSKP